MIERERLTGLVRHAPLLLMALAIGESAVGMAICTWLLVVQFADNADQITLIDRGTLLWGIRLIVFGVWTFFIGVVALVYRRQWRS